MFKITIVSGPGRGTSWAVRDGQSTLGRREGNDVVLPSRNVSKVHCVLHVQEGNVVLRDENSSNGTFVNGVLVQSRTIRPGDRIGLGDCILELRHVSNHGMLSAMPVARIGGDIYSLPTSMPTGPEPGPSIYIPDDFFGKLKWYVEKYFMPFFYALFLRYDWKTIAGIVLGFYSVLCVVLAVYPIIDQSRNNLLMETTLRARYIARALVEKNAVAISEGMETKTDLGIAPKDEGVRIAALIDLNGRIIAPHSKMNQQFTGGDEAKVLLKVLSFYRNGEEKGITTRLTGNSVMAIEPVKVFLPQLAKNAVVAVALVSIDASLTVPGLGEMGVVFSEALVITTILAVLCAFILFRITLKPLEILNEDMDKALKGDLRTVTREFRHEELEPLLDVIDSALQRMDRGEKGIDHEAISRNEIEETISTIRLLSEDSFDAVIVLDHDKKIRYLNSSFQEITGIRLDGSSGLDLPSVARDQAFGSLALDVLDRSQTGAVIEDFDFSGVAYKLHCEAIGNPTVKAFVMKLSRVKEEAA